MLFQRWELCGEAGDGQEAIRLAETLRPEIIIMDVSMPGLNGLEATRHHSRYSTGHENSVAYVAFLHGAGAHRLPRRSTRLRTQVGRGARAGPRTKCCSR